MNQAIRKLSGLLVLPVLLAALLLYPVRAHAEGYECVAELPVHVELNGDTDEQFHVTLACAPDADPAQPMPDEAEDGLWLAGDSDAAFTNFRFTEPGDYKYIVTQESGSTEYMTYDDVVYTVVIQVTNLETETGTTLQYQVYANTDDDPDTKVAQLRFLNTYAPPAPATPTPATPAPANPDEHPEIEQAIKDGTWGATPTPAAATWHIPQTSDAFPLLGLVAVLIVAAVAIVALLVFKKRNNKQDGQP